MKKFGILVLSLLLSVFTLSACGEKEAAAPMESVEAMAMDEIKVAIINSKGVPTGQAILTQAAAGVIIRVTASKLTPGKHGLHFHQNGACDPPDFQSAGEHFNPEGKKHGYKAQEGYHAGDLPNLIVGNNGKVDVELFTSKITLEKGKPNSLVKEGGTALIIHEGADDYKTDPTGNSGGRAACGVIK